MDVQIVFRDPLPPHTARVTTRAAAGSLRYGFSLMQTGRASFALSRADPAVLDALDAAQLGMMVTLERNDKLLPFCGYITDRDISLTDPTVKFSVEDVAGALLDDTVTPLDWPERETAAGEHIRAVLADCRARAAPPPIITLGDASPAGPVVAYTPKGETFIAMLNTLARATGWEWGLAPSVGGAYGVSVLLQWRSRIGSDRRGLASWKQGGQRGAFREARLHESKNGFLSVGVAVGGSGTFRLRPAETAGRGAAAGTSVPQPPSPALQQIGGSRIPTNSPALSGTRVLTLPTVTNRPALAAAARRLHTAPEYAAQRMTLELVEVGGGVDMALLELGSAYTVKFGDLVFGLGYEAAVRVMGISLGEDGIVECTVEVERGVI